MHIYNPFLKLQIVTDPPRKQTANNQEEPVTCEVQNFNRCSPYQRRTDQGGGLQGLYFSEHSGSFSGLGDELAEDCSYIDAGG